MSIRGVQEYIMYEPELCHVAKMDGNVPKGIAGSLSAGEDAGFARALGVTAVNETIPEIIRRAIPGDGGVIAYRSRIADAAAALNISHSVIDQVNTAALEGRTIYTEGSYEMSMRSRRCVTFTELAYIVSGRCESQESGTVGQKGWYTIFYWRVTGARTGLNQQVGSEVGETLSLTMNEVDTTWWEEDISTNYGQDYAYASDPIITDYPVMIHTFIGDNSTTTFTVDYTPVEASGTPNMMWKDGTKQAYTTNFTVTTATKTFTLASAPATDTDNVTWYEYIAPC